MSIKSTSNDSPSFAEVYTAQRQAKARNEFLERVDFLIDWRPIRTFINKKLNKTAQAKGEATYDGVLMFKILLLEVWYNLSDRAVEERINDSISFGKFLGIDMEHVSPDHSTICRFRNALVEKELWDKLLSMINKQLKKHGIMEIKRGVLVDASIVDSPFSPDGSIRIEVADDREDHRSEEEKIKEQKYMATRCSGKPGVDKEGRWVKKGGKFRFGYKKHIATTDEGLIEGVITTSANVSDTREFVPLIDKIKLPKGVEVLADKGYTSKGNSEHLRQSELTDKIMKKAKRGQALSEEEKEFNRLISKTRSKVERTFGSIRRWFKGGRCRYKGLLKTHGQNILESICHNIKRAPTLIIQLAADTK
ncbi:IS5 family transposase [Falsiporphyromonas endometrii]|uniref:IS5 family transposase n=1 Tax=Falsiporphyromonas endometrii TaxID=1387297 RepID=A0ABV9K644_9PORP